MFKAATQGTREPRAYKQICHQILLSEFKYQVQQRDNLSASLSAIRAQLDLILAPEKCYQDWLMKINRYSNKRKREIKQKHLYKLAKLGLPQNSRTKRKMIYNFSTKALTDLQYEALEKGPDFVRSGKKLDKLSCIVQTEKLFKEIRDHAQRTNYNMDEFNLKQELRRITLNFLKLKDHHTNFSKTEAAALQDLINEDNIIIVKSDKVNAYVILDKSLYLKKGKEFLHTDQFSQIQQAEADSAINNFQKFLDKIRRKKLLQDHEYDRLKPTRFRNADAYFLPKIHKPKAFYNLKFRPIVSCLDAYSNNAAKYLARLLREAILAEFNHGKVDSFTISKELQSITLTGNSRLLGFDIESLYPSIPLNEANEIAADLLVKHKKTDIPKKELIELLESCTKGLTFQFNGEYFKQNDGVPMGSPIAPVLAEIFLQNLEHHKFIPAFNQLKINKYWRFVDDGLLLVDNESKIEEIKQLLNSLHPKIKFTFEIEENQTMHFLDINLQRTERNFITSIYRKPCHPLLFHNWNSNIAIKYKIAVIRNLYNPALWICSNEIERNKECINIRGHLQNSGYPIKLIKHIEIQEGKKKLLPLELKIKWSQRNKYTWAYNSPAKIANTLPNSFENYHADMEHLQVKPNHFIEVDHLSVMNFKRNLEYSSMRIMQIVFTKSTARIAKNVISGKLEDYCPLELGNTEMLESALQMLQ